MQRRIAKLIAIAEERGLSGVAKAVRSAVAAGWRDWSDRAIDRRYGLDTHGIVEPESLDHVGEHGVHSTGHEAIQAPLFRRMIHRAAVDYRRTTFIDFGSGKGRAVILAAHFPFLRIIGLEASPTLDHLARDNVEAFRRQRPDCPQISLCCQDAAEHSIPTTALLCFLYNPFGPAVLNKVLTNLRHSAASHPREIAILYRNPVFANCFDRFSFLTLEYAGADYHLYRARYPVKPDPFDP